jgi:hydroxyacylglutathione hydrolase
MIVADGDPKLCAAVDPGEAAPVLAFLKAGGFHLTHVLCTHHHHDHIGGARDLAAATGCEIVASAYDRDRVAGCTQTVDESHPLSLWDEPVEIIELPGHTLGQIAFYLRPEKALFAGDTLFSAGCGRLFEGSPEQMVNSLGKLRRLPPDTRLYFGHEYTLRNLEFVLNRAPSAAAREYERECRAKLERGLPTTPTTLAVEAEVNPFFTATDVTEFRRWREARDHW